jgi:hypothetical protein
VFGQGLRRLGRVVLAVVVAVAVVSLLVGLALGASAQRSVSVGFSVAGAVVILIGFFVGNRGPFRVRFPGDGAHVRIGWARPREREETINLSALFVGLGFVLLLVGIGLDPRHPIA